jgi:protein SCO1/2
MPDLSRRKLLTSIAVAPAVGALVSTAAAQSGVYGYGAPANKPSPAGTPAHFDTSCSIPPASLLESSRIARERIQRLHFPDVVLENQHGKKVRFYSDLLKNKVVVFNFFYAKCEGVCPGVTANLSRLYRLLGDRMGNPVFMYSITLKPEEDTLEVINEYARAYENFTSWTFWRGNGDDIEKIRRGIGFVDPNPVVDRDKSQHIGNIRFGNEAMMQWAACPGLAHATWLAKAVSAVIPPDARRT